MLKPDFLIQDDIARAVIETVPGRFERIAINYELDYENADDGPITAHIFFGCCKDSEWRAED